MTEIICGWCRKSFESNVSVGEHGCRSVLICVHCGKILPSSKKKSTENVVGRKHLHEEYKKGDVAT